MTDDGSLDVGGRKISLSNLEKQMFPQVGFSKGDLINYYIKVAPYLLPHLKNRPITVKRYPDGVDGKFFYEKNAPRHTPKWVETAPVKHKSKSVKYVMLNDLASLVWSANLASIEIHPLLFRWPVTERPSFLVFDLDPGPGTDVFDCIEVAVQLEKLLQKMKLELFAKVSGSKGMQLYIPLNSTTDFEQSNSFAKAVAQRMEQEMPGQIVSKMTKSLRHNKVFIDWSQNSSFKSTVSVYSLRAKRAIPFVSFPFTMRQLKNAARRNDVEALYLQPATAIRVLEKKGDSFSGVLNKKQRITSAHFELLEKKVPLIKQPRKEAKVKIPRPKNNKRVKAPQKSLSDYRKKRNFDQTSEPPPVVKRHSEGARKIFVIQKHQASHLHFDFRIEVAGVLKSWAVPKGPPLETSARRLAMQVEDHPKDYARFEGNIPKGNYGAGSVIVWDRGTYSCRDQDPIAGLKDGKLVLELKGQKLQGTWILVRDKSDNKRWLMMMSKEAKVKARGRKLERSVISNRTLNEVARDTGDSSS